MATGIDIEFCLAYSKNRWWESRFRLKAERVIMSVKVNLKTVRDAVRNLQEFRCNETLDGNWVNRKPMTGMMSPEIIREMDGMFVRGDKFFVVKSYDTPIAVYNPAIGWWINPAKYSVTTSRHMSAIRAGIN